MKVKFCYMDSATGETDEAVILEITDLTGEAIVKAFNEFYYLNEPMPTDDNLIFKLLAFDKTPENTAAAVLMSTNDSYFGHLMLTGFAYVTSNLAVPHTTGKTLDSQARA